MFTLLLVFLPLLWSPPASAGALGVSMAAPATLYVDGERVDVAPGERPVWFEVAGGTPHVIEARTSSNRPITSLEVLVPDGFEVVVAYRDRHFAITGLAHTAVRAPPVRAPVAPVASTAPVPVEFRAVNGDWADVFVDGQKIGEFRVNSGAITVSLLPGPHKVEVRDFMGKETWASGHLNVSGTTTLKVGFGEEIGLEVYNLPSAWTP